MVAHTLLNTLSTSAAITALATNSSLLAAGSGGLFNCCAGNIDLIIKSGWIASIIRSSRDESSQGNQRFT
jgi:hypothetical protein